MKKKLQVFVSSTYLDLLDERQAAVEAILRAGHIPAGMELFAAGDKSQLETIQRWIDESDVFMLILGGRYGSCDADSGKSYTQLEYEYAIARGKRFFAVVLSEQAIEKKLKKKGAKAIEQENHAKLKAFRAAVTTKICRITEDVKDIKLAIHETLNELQIDTTFDGWVSGRDLVAIEELTKQIAHVAAENGELRNQLKQVQVAPTASPPADSDLEEAVTGLASEVQTFKPEGASAISKSALDWFLDNQKRIISGIPNRHGMSKLDNFLFYTVCPTLSLYGLTEDLKVAGVQWHYIKISPKGKRFLIHARSLGGTKAPIGMKRTEAVKQVEDNARPRPEK